MTWKPLLLGQLALAAAQASARVVTVVVHQCSDSAVGFPTTLNYPTNPASYNATATGRPGNGFVYRTTTVPYTGTKPINFPLTTTIPASGNLPDVVEIATPSGYQPSQTYVTVSEMYTGSLSLSEATTITTIQPSGTQLGTIVIQTPSGYVVSPWPATVYSISSYLTSGVLYTTRVPVASSSSVRSPAESGSTASSVAPEPQASTPSESANTQSMFITATQLYTGSDSISRLMALTTIPSSGSQPGTIIYVTPTGYGVEPSYITSTLAYTAGPAIVEPITTAAAEPSNGQPGTVSILIPSESQNAYTPSASILNFVTTTLPYTGVSPVSEPVTSTIAPSGLQPGTILVLTPSVADPSPRESQSTFAGPTVTSAEGEIILPTGGNPEIVENFTPSYYSMPTPSLAPTPSTLLLDPQSSTSVSPAAATPSEEALGLAACPLATCGTQSTNATLCDNTYGNSFNVTCARRLLGNIVARAVARDTNYYSTIAEDSENCELFDEVADDEPAAGVAASERSANTDEGQPDANNTDSASAFPTAGASAYGSSGPPIAGSTYFVSFSIASTASVGWQTSTRAYSGTAQITRATTVSTVYPSGTASGLYIIENPDSQSPGFASSQASVTPSASLVSTSANLGPSPPAENSALNPASSLSNSVPQSPAGLGYVTTTIGAYTGNDSLLSPTTVSTVAPSGSVSGTYYVQTPRSSASAISSAQQGSDGSQTTAATSVGYVTLTGSSLLSQPTTVTTIDPQGSVSGTYVVEYPPSSSANLSLDRSIELQCRRDLPGFAIKRILIAAQQHLLYIIVAGPDRRWIERSKSSIKFGVWS
ncbi:hypothetical protein Slin15195_G113230 [Septoria linicola]|uniref:Uncharacterized protein n=1 Tax=Septoria linicola TaxID=215465 RepID=A0A9Q9EPS6_9PEZI|nr:hypothetical protein Slin15195_G113230 [Septoria linicola]